MGHPQEPRGRARRPDHQTRRRLPHQNPAPGTSATTDRHALATTLRCALTPKHRSPPHADVQDLTPPRRSATDGINHSTAELPHHHPPPAPARARDPWADSKAPAAPTDPRNHRSAAVWDCTDYETRHWCTNADCGLRCVPHTDYHLDPGNTRAPPSVSGLQNRQRRIDCSQPLSTAAPIGMMRHGQTAIAVFDFR